MKYSNAENWDILKKTKSADRVYPKKRQIESSIVLLAIMLKIPIVSIRLVLMNYLHSLSKQVQVLRASAALADGMIMKVHASKPATFMKCNWLHSLMKLDASSSRKLITRFICKSKLERDKGQSSPYSIKKPSADTSCKLPQVH